MALFSRNKTDQNVLPEIEKYYDAEKRERVGLAWLLAIVSIACAALVFIGLFFGGRWVYRKATNTNKTPGVSTIKTGGESTGIVKNPGTSVGSNAPATGTPPATPQSPSTTTPATTQPSNTAPSTPTPTPTPAPAIPTPTTPAPAQTPTKLANTGPANTALIFVITTVGFAALHNILTRARRSVR